MLIATSTFVTGYAAIAVTAFALQRRLLFPVPEVAHRPNWKGATLHEIPSGMGTVFALHRAGPAGSATVVHFHGNAEQLADTVAHGAELNARGLGFNAIEFPGYGLAHDGAPSEASLWAAAESALSYLENHLKVSREQIVLEGRSLGTGVSTEMARRGWGARLVLISPYTSIPDMAAQAFGFLPAVGWCSIDSIMRRSHRQFRRRC